MVQFGNHLEVTTSALLPKTALVLHDLLVRHVKCRHACCALQSNVKSAEMSWFPLSVT